MFLKKSYQVMFDIAKEVRGTTGEEGFRSTDELRIVVTVTEDARRNSRKYKC